MSSVIRELRKNVCRISPVLASKMMYRKIMGKRLNLKQPQTFNEKIQWLKLYDLPQNPLAIQCADKLLVREYVARKGCSQYLNELYGAWDKPGDIPWDALPEQFVIKCNHGCAYNIICDDKNKLDITSAKNKLVKWMKEDFALTCAEMHYQKIPRKIICERYLGKEIYDYKFFCFHGEPKLLYFSQGTMHVDLKMSFFNLDGTPSKFRRLDYPSLEKPLILPDNIDEMLDICKKLSADFPFARIDLFCVEKHIYFSEITLTPSAGQMPLAPESADLELGKMLQI